MRIASFFQFIFISMIIIGMFASMARNSYGFDVVAAGFFMIGFSYALQAGWALVEEGGKIQRSDLPRTFELIFLAGFFALLSLRFAYYSFAGAEIVFSAVCFALSLVYLIMGRDHFKSLIQRNVHLARSIVFLNVAVAIFVLSLGVRIFSPTLSLAGGILAFFVSIPFLVAVVRATNYELHGKNITAVAYVRKSRIKAGLLLSLLLLSVTYLALSTFDIAPSIETSSKPKTYLDLVRQAETGQEEAANGKYKHEIYETAMDRFLERHSGN